MNSVCSPDMKVVIPGGFFADILSVEIVPLVNGACPKCGYVSEFKWSVNCRACICRGIPDAVFQKRGAVEHE